MDSNFLSNLPWLQILVAGLAYFALGAIWYGTLFSKKWVAYQNIDINDPSLKQGTAAIMLCSLIWMMVASLGLGILVTRLQLDTLSSGIKWGLLTGVCFSAMSISVTYLYVKKPIGLHMIDGLYHIVGQVIACVILCLWK